MTEQTPALQNIGNRIVELIALVVLAPLLAVISAAVKLFWPGPVLSQQKHIGPNGCVFSLYKFRSQHGGRITQVGRLLHMYSLDELPLFWNVLRGDISLRDTSLFHIQ